MTYDEQVLLDDEHPDEGVPPWRCPECASILQQPGPASRRDGRWDGWCPDHGVVAGVHGDRATILARSLP